MELTTYSMDHTNLELGPVTAQEAIQEAMMMALSQLFLLRKEEYLFDMHGVPLTIESISFPELEYRITRGQCKTASILVAEYLFKKFSSLFETLFVYVGRYTAADGPITDKWHYHAFCVAETTEGKWVAVSPANLHGQSKDPLRLQYWASSIDALYMLLKISEGAIWVLPSDIQRMKRQGRLQPEQKSTGEISIQVVELLFGTPQVESSLPYMKITVNRT